MGFGYYLLPFFIENLGGIYLNSLRYDKNRHDMNTYLTSNP